MAWKSRVQPLVALSSTEAEIIAVDDLARAPHQRHTKVLLGLAPLRWQQQLAAKDKANAAAGKAVGGWRPGAGSS